MSSRRSEKKREPATIKRNSAAAAERTAPAPRWLGISVPLAVLTIVFAAFTPALNGQFLNWDDDINFTDNPHWRGLGAAQLRWMFGTFHQGHYQPLTWLTLGLDYELWGHDAEGRLSPRGYHFTNNLLHALNALLVYFLAIALMRRAARRDDVSDATRAMSRDDRPSARVVIAAAMAALLWGAHPLRAESVAWITERRDLVSGTFILLTVLAYLRYVDSAFAARQRLLWYALVTTLFVLSLLGKVIGVTLPVVMLVLDWYPLRRISWSVTKPPTHTPGTVARLPILALVLEKLPWFAIAFVFGAIVTHFDRERGWLVPLSDHPLPARIAQACYGLVFYLWKSIVPVNLVPLYEMERGMNPIAGRYALYAVSVLAAAVGLIIMRRRWPGALAGAIVYLILLGPTLGLAQTGPQLVADRYSYLSTIGWAILIGAGLLWLMRHQVVVGRCALVATMAAISTLSIATWQQSKIWKDSFTLWEYACARKNVHGTYAWAKYGLLLRDRGDLPAAEAALKRAIEIRPELGKAHMYLGSVYDRMGRLDDAAAAFKQAMTLDPRAFEPAYNYGYVLMRQNRLGEAADAFTEALRHRPGDTARVDWYLANAHGNLGMTLLQLGRTSEAAEHIEKAKLLDPTRAQALEDWARSVRDAQDRQRVNP